MKPCSKRAEQTARVLQATVGTYGDLQGIADKTLQKIEGLELKALDGAGSSNEYFLILQCQRVEHL